MSLCVLLLGLILVGAPTSESYPLAYIVKRYLYDPVIIQYGTIVTERFILTSRYPMDMYPIDELCVKAHIFRQYCHIILTAKMGDKRINFQVLELADDITFTFNVTTGPIRIFDKDHVRIWDFQIYPYFFKARDRDLAIKTSHLGKIYWTRGDIEFYSKGVVVTSAPGSKRDEKSTLYTDFTRETLFFELRVKKATGLNPNLCPYDNGRPVVGDGCIMGMVVFAPEECEFGNVELCKYGCKELSENNYQFTVLSFMHKNVQEDIKEFVKDFI